MWLGRGGGTRRGQGQEEDEQQTQKAGGEEQLGGRGHEVELSISSKPKWDPDNPEGVTLARRGSGRSHNRETRRAEAGRRHASWDEESNTPRKRGSDGRRVVLRRGPGPRRPV